jgi:hypothetical protein
MTTSPLVFSSVISFHVQGTGRQSRSFLRQQLPSRQQAVPFPHPLVRFLLQVKWGLHVHLDYSFYFILRFPAFLSLLFVFAGRRTGGPVQIKKFMGRPRVYAQSFFLAQKSNQNTWFSTTLDFFLDFCWFSAFFPTLCTVLSKKTKLSCFGGFFSLVF